MTLSMTSPINAGDIFKVTMFKELKVWKLGGLAGAAIVIKTDAVGEAQIKSAGTIAKAVDPSIKMKILTKAETDQLGEYVKYFEEICAYYDGFGISNLGFTEKERKDVASLKESLSFGFPFTKMSMQQIHNIEDAVTARGANNKAIVGEFVTALRAPGGLEKLGQIVAADLFNGNTDRFMPDSNSQKTIGPYTFDFKVLVNPGNVMIVANGNGGYQASLLDYVDPNSSFKDINKPLAQAENNKRWPGRVLVDKAQRKRYARHIISDMEQMLSPKKHWLSTKTKLGSEAQSRLEAGMVEGAALIKTGLEAKFNPNRWTAGAKERYTLMCQVRA